MPAGDKTGPAGMGPMSGRGAGDCSGMTEPGAGGRGFGAGRGWGGGRGRCARGWGGGRGWGFGSGPGRFAPPSPAQELNELKRQAQAVSRTLEETNARIQDLELAKPESK